MSITLRYYWFYSLPGCLSPCDAGTSFLQNVATFPPNYTVSHQVRFFFSPCPTNLKSQLSSSITQSFDTSLTPEFGIQHDPLPLPLILTICFPKIQHNIVLLFAAHSLCSSWLASKWFFPQTCIICLCQSKLHVQSIISSSVHTSGTHLNPDGVALSV
jgi:hypothetical protein